LLLTLSFVAAVGLPAGVGLSLVADPLVKFLFTANWHSMIPIIQILAIYSVFRMLLGPSVSVFMANGKIRFLATISALMLPIRLLCIAIGWHYGELVGVAVTVLLLAAIQSSIMIISMSQLRVFDFSEFVRYSWRSFFATFLMAIFIAMIVIYCDAASISPLVEVVTCIFVGAFSYILVHAGLWWLSGRPYGVESILITELKNRVAPFSI
jgi:lipopolysaccharide exporter